MPPRPFSELRAQRAILDQTAKRVAERGVVVRRDERRGVVPDLAEALYVSEHERAAGLRGLERPEPEGLVARRQREDRRPREELVELRSRHTSQRRHVRVR